MKKNILQFSDGKFAFFSFKHENPNCMADTTIIRVRKTGKGRESRNPKERIKKLICEYGRQGMPDMVEFYTENCKNFQPSSIEEITKWLHAHPYDLLNFLKTSLDKK